MKNKWYILLFVLLIAVSLFAFQYVAELLSDAPRSLSLETQYLLNLPACILVGGVDFFIIFVVHKRLGGVSNAVKVFVGLLLASVWVSLFGVVANYALSIILNEPWPEDYAILKMSLPVVLWNCMIVLLIEIFFYQQSQMEAEKKLALVEKEKIQYQYETLKAQINPHFLFNSLNVLSSLAYSDAEKTNQFAKKLSGVYRYLLLTNNRPMVTLKEELDFLERYIFLEKIRFEDALFIEIGESDLYGNRQIIPVSLQLLVENAIKHNIATLKSPLVIRIDMADDGIMVSNNLQLRTSVDRGGVGLGNLQKQYALYNKEIAIIESSVEFTVRIPFLE